MSDLIPWTKEDFADSFQRHMPTGPIWPREPDTTQRAAVEALMPTYVRSWGLACDIPNQTLPSSAVALLPEWEASLGLPDPCAGEDATIAQRQMHVVARLTQRTGPSIPDLVAFAAGLGFGITIQEFTPCRADAMAADDPCNEPAWAFVWQISAPSVTLFYFTADEAFADDMVETSGGSVLECEMERIAPPHTTLQFSYSSTSEAAL